MRGLGPDPLAATQENSPGIHEPGNPLLISPAYVRAMRAGHSEDRRQALWAFEVLVRETQMDVGSVSSSNATSTAIEGLKKATNTIDNAAQNIAGGSQDPQDIVSLSTAATSFKANAAVIKTNDEMTKLLLDITA